MKVKLFYKTVQDGHSCFSLMSLLFFSLLVASVVTYIETKWASFFIVDLWYNAVKQYAVAAGASMAVQSYIG